MNINTHRRFIPHFLCMGMEGAEGEREYVCVHASILNHAKIVDGLQMLWLFPSSIWVDLEHAAEYLSAC